MYQFCEQAIRGGVCTITKRYAKANNKDLPDYDSSIPSNYLWYIDANNLYGCSMVEKLPISGFKWSTLTLDEIKNYNTNSDVGYFVEVDLTIPDELHDKFNCFPLAPEPLDITENVASPKSLEIRSKRTEKEIIIEEAEESNQSLLKVGIKRKSVKQTLYKKSV